jgi:hypothetical protein
VTVTDWISAVATAVVAVFTIALFWVGWRQIADTKILQRAYLSVKPQGIVSSTNGLLVGHVAFNNVGKLPATEFVSVVMKIKVHHAKWVTPILTDNALPKDINPGLVPIGAEVPQGSEGITPGEVAQAEVTDDKKYLYVWGRAKFKDGFDRDRWVNFCHRYPWAKMEVDGDGSVTISKRWARYHDEGNKAN